MDHEVEHKLETLRSDYQEVTEKPFLNFFCPMLFRDEDVALCRAHIVNSAFPDSCRRWTRFNGPMLIVSMEVRSKAIL